MDGSTIDRALRNNAVTRRIYRGVASADDTAACLRRPGFYVYNTDPSWLPGKHWIAQYNDGTGRILHFDSYGLPPFGEMAAALDASCPSTTAIAYHDRRLQGAEKTCGHYCLYYALHTAQPSVYGMDAFDEDDLNGNDLKVTAIVEHVFDGLL